MIDKLISRLGSAEENKLFKTEHTLPNEVMLVYNKILDSFVDYYCDSVIKNENSKKRKLNNGFTPVYNDKQYDRKNALKKDFIFKSGGKDTLIDNIKEITQRYVLVAGGCVSDKLISDIHNTDYNPKDIDIFVNASFIRGILNEQDLSDRRGDYNENKIIERILRRHNIVQKRFFDEEDYANKIEYIFNLELDDYKVEVIGCYENKLLEFDLSIRNVFANNNGIYTFPSVIEDIKKRQINIFSMTTPLSNLFRSFNMAKRYNFEVTDNARIFLGSKLDGIKFDTYQEFSKKSSHFSEAVEILAFREMQIQISKRSNDTFLKFPISSYKGFSRNIGVKLYKKFVHLLEEKDSPFVYPLIEQFLSHFKKIKFVYSVPESLPIDRILDQSSIFRPSVRGWFNNKYLKNIFETNDSPGYNYAQSYRDMKVSDDDLDSLHNFFYGGDNLNFSKKFKKLYLPEFVPTILSKEEIFFKFHTQLHNLRRGVVGLNAYSSAKHTIIHFQIDTEQKIIRPYTMSGNYFGMIDQVYYDFLSQIKDYFKLDGYEISLEAPDKPVLLYSDKYSSNFTYYLKKADV